MLAERVTVHELEQRMLDRVFFCLASCRAKAAE